jgi:hypothetical protein
MYNDEEFFKSTTDNIVLNIFETNCDFDGDGIIDNVKIKQLINNKESNAPYKNSKLLYTDLYINNIKPQSINVYSVSGIYEILSIETHKLNNRNIIIVNRKNIYSEEIDKEGIRLNQDGTAIGIKEKSLNN